MAASAEQDVFRKQTLGENERFNDLKDYDNIHSHVEKSSKYIFDGRIVWTIILGVYFLGFMFIMHRVHVFPEPKTHLASSNNDSFYESNARVYLNGLALHGPRVTGSRSNEFYAYTYILEELDKINKNSFSSKRITIDTQNVSGSFNIAFLTDFVSVYQNIKNIAVKLHSETGSSHSLLMSCHFDSAVDSPGAGDNAISCAVMLEVLRVFTQSSRQVNHNIIFLFNGAEENLLQASHGFITAHPWAESIQAFVNIDSAGAGGWEMVFQTGPAHPWLTRAYAESSPYPCGSIFGQELFQSGLVLSDTDYRIYRDFGQIPGLDIAYISNGYVYHTQNDQNRFIQPGCVQRGGENLLALLWKLSSSPKLADPGLEKEGKMIFFDILGYFMVYYPVRIAVIINSGLVAAILFKIIRKTFNIDRKDNYDVKYFRNLLTAIFCMILTWLIIILTCVSMATLMTLLGRNMTWYTHNYNLIPVYILTCLITVLIFHDKLQNTVLKTKSMWYNEQMFFEANLTIWALILMVLTILGIGSAYVPMLLVLGPLFIRDRTLWIFQNSNWKGRPYLFLSLHLFAQMVPCSQLLYLGLNLFTLFIPIMGRAGSAINSDLLVGGFMAIVIIPAIGYLVGISYICSNMKKVIYIFSGVTVVWLLSILVTPLGFPYSGNTQHPSPMRLLALHAERRGHNLQGDIIKENSGIWVLPFDYNHNKYLVQEMAVLKDAHPVVDCDIGPYCGLPYLIPVIMMFPPSTTLMLPTEGHGRPPVVCSLVNTQKDAVGLTHMAFHVTGPDHMLMQVRPHPGVTLESWSLTDLKPIPSNLGPAFNDTVYAVYYSYGEQPASPWSFTLHLKIPEGHSASEGVIDIGLAGQYLHSEDKLSPQLSDFIQQAPDWSTPIHWVASWDGFVF